MTSYQGHPAKSRGTIVKPILRKLTQSERNSLDLDRSAAEQNGLGIEYGYGYGSGSGMGMGMGMGMGSVLGTGNGNGSGPRSSHDVQLRRGYHHRSTSGTSQFSTATTGSGHRAGSFVHPFQQTPRPYTPPIAASASYQNSLRESELDHSPALTEDEDHPREQTQIRSPNKSQSHIHPFRSPSNLSNHTSTPSITGVSTSSPNISQSQKPHALRVLTSKQGSSSRLALATSHTSLHNTTLSSDIASPTETMSPVSAIRGSLDKGFRIRSRSEVDTRLQAETIQEARRKFQEKEQAKEEKAAREEIRALEKRQQKEARQIERGHRRSSASNETRSKRSKSDLTMQEKDGFVGRDYNSVPQQQTPTFMSVGEEQFSQPRRSGTAKLKTHSAWTKFVMWIRTRFIRMSKKKN
ncbi:hypothetical protein ONS95_009135 [Cadophora gregata]|uniref:uncharacterized protein n=1 Tax=Cadophora gregata TaxID=51156 RepID=UPI0026DA7BFF|nr:uncharacterized protein ONS95_009135 [Cadophora gregata]KAK0124152.1 hypothetical protein ONS95_009135 [Cadophora gregata]